MADSKLTILVDVDDVMIDLLGAWCNWLDLKYGLTVHPEDITEWDIQKAFPTLTKHQIYSPFHNDLFWRTISAKKDSIKYLKQLYNEGHEIYACTATDYRNVFWKHWLVHGFFPFLDQKNLIVTYHKQMIEADVLIDDGIHNLIGGNYHKILFTAPHNKSFNEEAHGIVRANNWKEAYFAVKLIAAIKNEG